MNTTPEDPAPGPSEPDPATPPPEPPPTTSREASATSRDVPGGATDPLSPLEDELPERRFLTSGRLLAIGAVAVAALVAGVGVVLAGDDSDPDPVASIDGDAVDDTDSSSDNGARHPDDAEFEDAMLEYTECMRDQGIDMPDPQFQDGGGVIVEQTSDDAGPGLSPGPGDEDFVVADEECGEILEDVRGEMTPPSPEEIAEMQDRLVAMAECMRARGHDMPDPEVDANGGGVRVEVSSDGSGDGGPPADVDQFETDQQECHEEAGLGSGPRVGSIGGMDEQTEGGS